MTDEPPLSNVAWPDARRIISSRYPPVDLFEDIADPRDWDLLTSAETKTNPRIAESVGRLDLVPAERRVGGPGASYLMAPFVHVSPDWSGRFHDGTFGAYYAARRFDTAVAETAYHKGVFYSATAEAAGWFSQMRELVCAIDRAFSDLRGADAFDDCLDPNTYSASQRLARRLRDAGSDGIVYPSVRDPDGECVAAFWPDVVGLPVQGRHLAYHFDGDRVDMIRDEASGNVWRLT
ncbi:RES family NAD+ phosphorylase [Henriciella aquimarina]|uniref:RES family NAD+ phosphorylase n=1 Tax=Henriciella aquimarina TaxID=545261 RepID=UPI000A027A8C|nr:RES family NAD+ phosphorylase [Henriciella aquimarina]